MSKKRRQFTAKFKLALMSARLDPVTENLIEQTIQRLFLNRTGIIIAHRLRTIRQLNDIMILGNGRVLEHGAREVLEIAREFFDTLTREVWISTHFGLSAWTSMGMLNPSTNGFNAQRLDI